MKKLLSVILTAVILAGALFVPASADGQMYVQSDFSDMDTFTNHFGAGAFFTEGGDKMLYGYAEAKALQTVDEWYETDTRYEIAIADDDMSDISRAISINYPNTNLYNYGRSDGTCFMSFSYDVETKELWLTGGNLGVDKEEILAGPISYDGIDDNGEIFFSFGMSVSRQRIRCFVNDELMMDYFDANDDYLIGLNDDMTLPTCMLFWNDGNYIQVKDIKIASPGYLFPFASDDEGEGTSVPADPEQPDVSADPDKPVDPEQPDVPDNGNDTPAEDNTPAGDNGNAEENKPAGDNKPADDNKPAQNNKPADTNTNKPAGGSATATGDVTFAVVLSMVAALGCALIVKKASVR